MKATSTVLDKIVAIKQDHLRARKAEQPRASLEEQLAAREPFSGPSFFEVLKTPQPQPKIIAEVKQASPSRGVLRPEFSPAEINEAYQASPNVVAISVITEQAHFMGSEDTLGFFAAHNTHHKPLLQKDFIFDTYQILESKLLGAQAYLLIASLFDAGELQALVDFGQSIGLEPLVEVHTRQELEVVRTTKARIIGVNARNLQDFSIDIQAHELLRDLDETYARVAESGIDSPEYLARISSFSDAALVGTSLMVAPDVPAAINRLVGLGERNSV